MGNATTVYLRVTELANRRWAIPFPEKRATTLQQREAGTFVVSDHDEDEPPTRSDSMPRPAGLVPLRVSIS